MRRSGAGLVEAVVAAALTALLTLSALAGLARLQRDVGRYASRAAADQSVRGTAQLLRSELRDLAPAAAEIISLAPGLITYRATRGTGLACGSAAGRILVQANSWFPLRQPAAGRDSLVLLAQPPDTEVAVASGGTPMAATCPDGVAALALPYVLPVTDPVPGSSFPTPILLTETMEIRGYLSAGEWWVGARSVSAGEAIQPAFGPIAPGGLHIAGVDSLGAPTVVPRAVRHLELSVVTPPGDSVMIRLDLSRGIWP